MFSRAFFSRRNAAIAATVALGLLVLLGGVFRYGASDSSGNSSDRASKPADLSALPMPEPQQVKPLTEDEARAVNDALPFASNALEAAPAFRGGGNLTDPLAYTAALDCLTAAVYYEAASESAQGQRAVAQVVLNRVRHPAFPARICDVVYQGSERSSGCQFSFTCDGSLARQPGRAGWDRARRIAEDALAGAVERSVGMATHYHTDWVAPYWAPKLDKIAASGAHIFYRWKGYWGFRQAFNQTYRGEAATAVAVPSDVPPFSADENNQAIDLGALEAPLAHLSATLVKPTNAAVAADEFSRRLVADDIPTKLVADDPKPRPPPDAVPAP